MSNRLKGIIGIAVAILLVIVILITPIKSVIIRVGGSIISPVCGFFNRVSSSVSEWGYSVFHAGETFKENEQLKSDLNELKNKLALYEGLENENSRLHSLLELKNDYSNLKSTAAEVIAREAGNWFTVFTINKGKNDGIDINQPVLTSGGLVGHTTEVGSNWAKIVTMIDTSHSASGMSVRSGSYVQIDGDISLMGGGLCKMTNISEQADVIIGDTIVTSGIGGVYPKDIVIGTVVEFKNSESGAGNYAIIKPSVDFSRLTEVLVLQTDGGHEE